MRIKILSTAEDDLEESHRFYESQTDGLGTYFLDTLYSDIDSQAYFAGDAPRSAGLSPATLQTFSICCLLSRR